MQYWQSIKPRQLDRYEPRSILYILHHFAVITPLPHQRDLQPWWISGSYCGQNASVLCPEPLFKPNPITLVQRISNQLLYLDWKYKALFSSKRYKIYPKSFIFKPASEIWTRAVLKKAHLPTQPWRSWAQ